MVIFVNISVDQSIGVQEAAAGLPVLAIHFLGTVCGKRIQLKRDVFLALTRDVARQPDQHHSKAL